MKKILMLIFLLLLTFCNSDITESDKAEEYGSVSILIKKNNLPDNIVIIEAILSREGFDDKTEIMNFLSSNSAEAVFNEMVAGTWHLKIEALDLNNVAIYAGEEDIDIKPDQVTPITLELIPVPDNLGEIYIYVMWNDLIYNWFDFPVNPIIKKNNNLYDSKGIAESIVIKDEDYYKMWYLGKSSLGQDHIFYAKSINGINWDKHGSTPVLSPGDSGEWDSDHVQPGPVIKKDGIYKMYYGGWQNENSHWHIGLATSTDGINWTKRSNPVLYGGSGWDFQIYASEIIIIDSVYHLYYAGENPSTNRWRIGLATSTDGVNWIKHSGNPIIEPSLSWENDMVGWPSIVYKDNLYKMIYHGNYSFGAAYSNDGYNWEKSNEEFFTNSMTVNDFNRLAYPDIIETHDEYRIYYTGFDHNNEPYICVARKFK